VKILQKVLGGLLFFDSHCKYMYVRTAILAVWTVTEALW